MNIDDLQTEYGKDEYYEPEYAGFCSECGAPLEVRSQDNGTETPNQVGYCHKCGIYYD